MTDTARFVMERNFAAPRALVWRCWTEDGLLSRWYGPGVETIIHELDVRPGGVWRNEMRKGGWTQHERMDFVEVAAPDRLVWLQGVTDEEWNVVANPMMPDWPRRLRAELVLTATAAGTHMRFTWEPHEASAAEVAAFAQAMNGLGRGWGAGMDILETLLVDLQA